VLTSAIRCIRKILRYLKIGRLASNSGVEAKWIVGCGPIGQCLHG
jgi:hypothetical protein